jgi:hypothetical protein
MVYRRSLQESLETLSMYEAVLSILENNSRDLSNLLAREGESPDKTSRARVEALVQEIHENRERAVQIFRRIGKKIQDAKRPPTADSQTPAKSRMELLREKYFKAPETPNPSER